MKTGAERQKAYRDKNIPYQEREKKRMQGNRKTLTGKKKKRANKLTRKRVAKWRERKKNAEQIIAVEAIVTPYATQSAEKRAVNRYGNEDTCYERKYSFFKRVP